MKNGLIVKESTLKTKQSLKIKTIGRTQCSKMLAEAYIKPVS